MKNFLKIFEEQKPRQQLETPLDYIFKHRKNILLFYLTESFHPSSLSVLFFYSTIKIYSQQPESGALIGSAPRRTRWCGMTQHFRVQWHKNECFIKKRVFFEIFGEKWENWNFREMILGIIGLLACVSARATKREETKEGPAVDEPIDTGNYKYSTFWKSGLRVFFSGAVLKLKVKYGFVVQLRP